MPTDTVKKFLKQAESSSEIQAKLQEIPKASGKSSIEDVVKVAAAAGYDFTAEDYEEALEETLAEKHAAGALSDSELALISGGLMCVSSDATKKCTCCKSTSWLGIRSTTQAKTTLG